MIREIQIKNFKSIRELTVELGRVNVLIGENGGGKSNILEAIALASAASQDKLDHEYLAARGIRVTEPQFMRAAFEGAPPSGDVDINVRGEGELHFRCSLLPDPSSPYPRWVNKTQLEANREQLLELVQREIARAEAKVPLETWLEKLLASALQRSLAASKMGLEDFLVYSPENSALRIFQAEGQILPLGIKGEGLFAHLKALNAGEHRACLEAIMHHLLLIDWFERFELPDDLAPGERSLRIRDRYLVEGAYFDQRSANEGFLLLLFYFTLFISPATPRSFAIDNIDASLNPKLCRALVQELVALAKEHERQVILTTHNPAILDGINLNDEEQRLFVVYRDTWGQTKLHRVPAPKPLGDEPPVPLSEAFMRGYIGGLPKNF